MDSGKQMGKAKETYDSFITMLKWSSVAVAIVTALVVALIA